MKLESLGLTDQIKEYLTEHELDSFETGRISAEHKERYQIICEAGEFEAEITGNLRFSASGRADFPAVGDWVSFTLFDDNLAIIHQVLPRSTILERQAVGSKGEKQIIGANIDVALIVQACDRDFNLNRLERYLTISNAAKVLPLILLSKSDLISDSELDEILNAIKSRFPDIPVHFFSNQTRNGIDEIKNIFEEGKTYCLLGSSGVGKSTLINTLTESEKLKTSSISDSTHKGKHTTTHRELFLLPNGGIIIDNPGMREIGMTHGESGLEETFDQISRLASQCRFSDCTHTHESGCALIQAADNGEIDPQALQNYLKMKRETEHFQRSVAEKRQKDKEFGKMVKTYKKIKGKNRL